MRRLKNTSTGESLQNSLQTFCLHDFYAMYFCDIFFLIAVLQQQYPFAFLSPKLSFVYSSFQFLSPDPPVLFQSSLTLIHQSKLLFPKPSSKSVSRFTKYSSSSYQIGRFQLVLERTFSPAFFSQFFSRNNPKTISLR